MMLLVIIVRVKLNLLDLVDSWSIMTIIYLHKTLVMEFGQLASTI